MAVRDDIGRRGGGDERVHPHAPPHARHRRPRAGDARVTRSRSSSGAWATWRRRMPPPRDRHDRARHARPAARARLAARARDVDPYPAYERHRAPPGPWSGTRGCGPGWCRPTSCARSCCGGRTCSRSRPGRCPDAHRIVGRRDIRSLAGRRARAAPSGGVARLAPGPHRAPRRWPPCGRSSRSVWRASRQRVALRAVRGVRAAAADLGHLARAGPAGRGRRHAGPGQDLDGGGARVAPLLRRGPGRAGRRHRGHATAGAAALDTVRARRDRPADDGISLLWQAGRASAPDWDEQDVLDNAKFMYEGGSETTAFLICTATHRLLELPQTRARRDARRTAARLRAVPGGGAAALDGGPPAGADRDRRRGPRGMPIRAGERVIAINGAANRDPERWERPDAIDPTGRALCGHLAFSVGPRHCAGAHLARMEATEAIGGLFRAFPDLRARRGRAGTGAHGLRVPRLATAGAGARARPGGDRAVAGRRRPRASRWSGRRARVHRLRRGWRPRGRARHVDRAQLDASPRRRPARRCAVAAAPPPPDRCPARPAGWPRAAAGTSCAMGSASLVTMAMSRPGSSPAASSARSTPTSRRAPPTTTAVGCSGPRTAARPWPGRPPR